MFRNKRYSNFYLSVVILASSIAAMGTIPYGFQFAQGLKISHPFLALLSGIILGFSAAFANAVLGIYSFLNLNRSKPASSKPFYIVVGSLLSAVPMGCMCYFAYYQLFPPLINAVLTVAVTLINAAISYTAIQNLIQDFKFPFSYTNKFGELICRSLGFFIGLGVSLTAYVAAVHGLTDLLSVGFQEEKQQAFLQASYLAFISWLPFAALFASATQRTMGKIFYLSYHFADHLHHFDEVYFFIIIISLCSGTSFAQVALTFFNPEMNIPFVFKLDYMQVLIAKMVVPLAFLSSASVNFIALELVLKNKISVFKGE